MPDSQEVQIADAIVSEFNDAARSWYATVHDAERKWLPVWIPSMLSRLKVAVVPLTLDVGQEGRKVQRFDYGFAMDFQKALTFTDGEPDDDEINDLSKLVQDVQDYYRPGPNGPHRLTGLTDALVWQVERTDIYMDTPMYEQQKFETALAIVVRVYR